MSFCTEPLEPRRLMSAATQTFEFADLPTVGTTLAGQDIALGGFSSLVYEGKAKNGNLKFIANTDRGPSGDTQSGLRAFLLPDYAPRLVRFELNPHTGKLAVTDQIVLKTKTGEPLSGLPNLVIPGASPDAAYNDEVPHDVLGNVLPFDRLGGDFEGLAVDPKDGSYWLVDEYRVSVYHFHKNGRLKERLVPEGTAAAAGLPAGTFGTEALPAVFAQRRPNRGFEGVAVQDGKVYAFMQSPLRNPTTLSNGALGALTNVRVLELNPKTLATRQFIYALENLPGTGINNRADKVGDVTAIGGGEFLLMERDTDKVGTDPVATIEKKVYRFSFGGATDVSDLPATFAVVRGPNTLQLTVDQMTPAELLAAGVHPIAKTLYVDLNAAGYNTVSNPEGLAFLDANTIAVINDNDFSIPAFTLDPATGAFTRTETPDPVLVGIVRLNGASIDPDAPVPCLANHAGHRTGRRDREESILDQDNRGPRMP